ncbi:MAG: DUF2628 domain-containing protein [Alphaproteobacteria bacterium]
MRIYTVHLPPPFSSGRGREAEVIREGFNWLAFLFSGLWMLSQGMWILGVAVLVLTGLAAAGLDYIGVNEIVSTVVTLAIGVYVGCSANDWRRAHLARKGWKEAAVIAATDPDGALRRYLDLAALEAAGLPEAPRAAHPQPAT